MHNRDLEIMRLNKELAVAKYNAAPEKEDNDNRSKVLLVGNGRRNKELRQIQAECDMLREEVKKLKENKQVDLENTSELKETAKETLAYSTLKSTLSELTNSQKLVIDNVRFCYYFRCLMSNSLDLNLRP